MSSTPTRSSSTRTPTSWSPATAGSSACARSRIPTRPASREGDAVTHVLPGSTKEKVIFFTNRGSGYVIKINDIAATTGYGDPAQKYFKFGDGERIVAAMTLDPRAMVAADPARGDAQGLRPAVRDARRTPRSRPRPAGATPSRARATRSSAWCRATTATSSVAATRDGHVLHCKADEIAKLEGPGRGVTVIKTDDDDMVIGFIAGAQERPARASRPRRAARTYRHAGRSEAGHRRAAARATRSCKKVHARRRADTRSTIQPLANAEGGQGVN